MLQLHLGDVLAAKAKYMRIYEWLEQAIKSGEFKVGDRLPNEVELAERFGVHRMTIRQAINKLVSDHVVMRKRGLGTFLVSDKRPVMVKSLDNLTTYRDDIMQAGLQSKYKMLNFERTTASKEVADNLQIEEGAPVIAFSRVMFANEVPLVVEHTRLPYDLFQNIEEQDLEEPLYLLMREKFQMSALYTEHEIGCAIPSGQERKLLHLDDGEPCLALYIISRDSRGRVVEFSNSLHRGDKYRFKCTIQQYILSNLKNGVKHD